MESKLINSLRNGINFTPIYLEFDNNLFEETDVISPKGTEELEYPVILRSFDSKDNMWTGQLITGIPEKFIPEEYLKPGVVWEKYYSKVEQTI